MTVASSAATALLVMVGAGDVALGIVLFAVAHVAHLLAMSLYNSYLPLIATPSRFARISGLAWGLSYLGSIACYFLSLPFTRGGLDPSNAANFTGAFAVAAVFLALIGLPAVLFLPPGAPNPAARDATGPYRRILATFGEWRRDRNVPKFLLAYYLVNDGVVTATFFTALTFRKSYGMEVQEILALTLVLQLVAIPATIFFGWLGGRWSQRGATNLALALWIAVLVPDGKRRGSQRRNRGHRGTGTGNWFDAEPVPQHVRGARPDRSHIGIFRLPHADGPDLGRVRPAGVRTGERGDRESAHGDGVARAVLHRRRRACWHSCAFRSASAGVPQTGNSVQEKWRARQDSNL